MLTFTSAPELVFTQPLAIAPTQVLRGTGILSQAGEAIARLGSRPLLVGGSQTLALLQPLLAPILKNPSLTLATVPYGRNCSETALTQMTERAIAHQADVILGCGGGKALDAAKLLAHQRRLPVVTLPTSAATCAGWTALSNLYTEEGAFDHDVALDHCPELLVLDYDLILTAPLRTLIAGIGDGLAKWYEASISSGHCEQTLTVAAVQQARVLRDILFQKSEAALQNPGSEVWRDVVDATVLMAGVIGGLGGAQCRTVAAHAVHNGLTHYPGAHTSLHGEKVAFGILVQLRLEELVQGSQLAGTARHQLLKFYDTIGLPTQLTDLGLGAIAFTDLQAVATVACSPSSDIHRLPFTVDPSHLVAAMVSTTAPLFSPPASLTNSLHDSPCDLGVGNPA